jgi:uncharacterized secreted protein with C-terminal beta-propeller domain
VLGRRGLLALSVTVLVVGAGAVQLLPGASQVASASGLVAYQDCDALLSHYQQEMTRTATSYGLGSEVTRDLSGDSRSSGGDSSGTGAPRAASESGAAALDSAVGPGATGTNLQEQGVDEPDLAKLKDGRLVVVARNALQLLSAQDQPQLLGSLSLATRYGRNGVEPSKGYDSYAGYGGELLLVGSRALVVMPGFRERPQRDLPHLDGSGKDARTSLYLPGTPTTRLVLVDLSTDSPRLIEDAVYDGQYVSARLVDGTVRLVTSTAPAPPVIALPQTSNRTMEQDVYESTQQAPGDVRLSDVLPQVVHRDAHGTVTRSGAAVGCSDVAHPADARGTSTLLVTTMRPADGLEATGSTAVTTGGDLVYASADRLYVATSRWGTVGPAVDTRITGDSDEVRTEIHAFDTTSATTTRYVGSGSVPGYVLGRWAFSEHEGTLRVATTRQPPWGNGQGDDVVVDGGPGETSSMVVKLVERGGDLVETGRVSGLGRTEQIKAVRYFGDLAVVVTFRQTDPLYLVDLAGDPKVVGELKVPGFSTYLHPIGDGLLLGLGQDATDQGQVTGMQLSVFDVSDPSRPSLVDRLPIGAGYSPALEDSRAVAYDPSSRLAVLPFHGYDESTGAPFAPSAVGISVGADGDLREVGRLATEQDNPPTRTLLDGERVYVVGDAGVVAGEPSTMSQTGTATFTLG